MTKRLIQLLSQLSFSSSVIRVNYLFFKPKRSSDLIRLENNFVFHHACMTPLTILSCSLDAIELEKNQLNQKDALNSAKYAVRKLTDIILATTKSRSTPENFSVTKSLKEVVLLYKKNQGCTVEYSNLTTLDTKIQGSKLYFQEMIICLLNNAIEAYTNKKNAYVSLVVRTSNNTLNIHIVDYASGMSLLAQKMAFIEGISYKEKGLGLGLFFTKKTVENQFNGQMDMYSRLGVGTQVKLTIPIQ